MYGFVNVAGISRGGPTDPVGEPGSSSPSWLLRGETGNGLTGPASYFNFDIDVLEGPSDRTVRLQIFAASTKLFSWTAKATIPSRSCRLKTSRERLPYLSRAPSSRQAR